jgi:hypothetical protein
MTSAVLMAGYNNEREVERYSRTVAEHYGEKFIESGYKPLREFITVADDTTVSKPLIQYTLEALFANEAIGEIVIVGHQSLLEQRLGGLIRRHDKPCRILNQNDQLGGEIVRTFNVLPRKVKRGSVAWNLVKGYAATAACRERRHALFVASDSPFTTNDFINRFLRIVERYEGEADIISPAIVIDGKRDKLGRLPLRLRNDSAFRLPGAEDEYGRQGFRLSSLLSANLHGFDINTANTAYDLRKALNPNVQLRLFKITRQLGYQNVYSKYFLHKDLSISEVEGIVSAFFRGRMKIVPMEGVESTYDYDGTDHEYRMISHLLKPGEEEIETGEDGAPAEATARSD